MVAKLLNDNCLIIRYYQFYQLKIINLTSVQIF